VTGLKDVAARLGAIDQYIAATSNEGRATVQATIRKIEQRVGQMARKAMAQEVAS
jgi:uncharacterized iron-regulated protein